MAGEGPSVRPEARGGDALHSQVRPLVELQGLINKLNTCSASIIQKPARLVHHRVERVH